MSLVELIAASDERALATAGLACLDRCVPLLTSDGCDDDVLRPLWLSIADGDAWPDRLAAARVALSHVPRAAPEPGKQDPEDEARELALGMLSTAPDALPFGPQAAAPPADGDALRAWADACSLAALHVHRLLDATGEPPQSVAARREGGVDGMSPLVEAELRRQTEILDLLAERGTNALRHALEVCTEGRRVLRAAVSRRARAR